MTLLDLSPRAAICGELMAERQHAQAASLLLDKVNRKYGNSALYLGSMAKAIDNNAAPMRIPFQQIPKPALEEETGLHGVEQSPANAADLLQARMNQFKVLAEKTHREREATRHRPSGAAGWGNSNPPPAPPQATLF